jgi:hypothetical protein
MNEILINYLKPLKTNEERQLCYESLAFLGLKHYFSANPNDRTINRDSLSSLAGNGKLFCFPAEVTNLTVLDR